MLFFQKFIINLIVKASTPTSNSFKEQYLYNKNIVLNLLFNYKNECFTMLKDYANVFNEKHRISIFDESAKKDEPSMQFYVINEYTHRFFEHINAKFLIGSIDSVSHSKDLKAFGLGLKLQQCCFDIKNDSIFFNYLPIGQCLIKFDKFLFLINNEFKHKKINNNIIRITQCIWAIMNIIGRQIYNSGQLSQKDLALIPIFALNYIDFLSIKKLILELENNGNLLFEALQPCCSEIQHFESIRELYYQYSYFQIILCCFNFISHFDETNINGIFQTSQCYNLLYELFAHKMLASLNMRCFEDDF